MCYFFMPKEVNNSYSSRSKKCMPLVMTFKSTLFKLLSPVFSKVLVIPCTSLLATSQLTWLYQSFCRILDIPSSLFGDFLPKQDLIQGCVFEITKDNVNKSSTTLRFQSFSVLFSLILGLLPVTLGYRVEPQVVWDSVQF